MVFKGFSSDTLSFLVNVRANNSRGWYQENKDAYTKYLLSPMQDLVVDLGNVMQSIDPRMEIIPKVDKTISRIHNDIRFSKDKTLYRDRMWITFKRSGIEWKEYPAYFFEISPYSYRYGMGFYNASKGTMDNIREMIKGKPNQFKEKIAFLSNQDEFIVEGESYKKVLNKEIQMELLEWYQRKNIYLVGNRKIDEIFFSEMLVEKLSQGFKLIEPFYHFLWSMII